MQKVHVLESCDNIWYMHVTLDLCLSLELDEKKMHLGYFCGTVQADQKNSLVSGPPTDPATTPPTVNFLQQSEQKVFYGPKKIMLYKLIC